MQIHAGVRGQRTQEFLDELYVELARLFRWELDAEDQGAAAAQIERNLRK